MTRVSILKTINSPLGFFALSLLTVEGFLGIVLIYSGLTPNGKLLGMLIGAGLFVLVVTIVFLLVWNKPKNLTFGEEGHLADEGKLYGENEPGKVEVLLTESEMKSVPKKDH
ncbi:MAG: hypothetical protein KAR54_02305 [Candidatus Pacebacteria bacterium]|nr:hypothetical protein [Candidatus Paceibacterota bacterium]